MFNVASDIGLPETFVKLRHNITHGDLPSLVVLRDATNRSLVWLWDRFWRWIDESIDAAAAAAAAADKNKPTHERDVAMLTAAFSSILWPCVRQRVQQVAEERKKAKAKLKKGRGNAGGDEKRDKEKSDDDDEVVDTLMGLIVANAGENGGEEDTDEEEEGQGSSKKRKTMAGAVPTVHGKNKNRVAWGGQQDDDGMEVEQQRVGSAKKGMAKAMDAACAHCLDICRKLPELHGFLASALVEMFLLGPSKRK
jgi:hypothetical protein